MLEEDPNQILDNQAQQTFTADGSSSTGDVSIKPIFTKNPLSWRFERNTKINNLVVSNNVAILHINEQRLQRRSQEDIAKDGKNPNAYQDVKIPDAINKMFFDPTGRILLVSTREKRDVYIVISAPNSLKLNSKPIRFVNNPSFILASVSWCNLFLHANSNQFIAIVAGQDGSIYEVSIRADGELLSCNEVYPGFKMIISSTRDSITGIYCDVKRAYEDYTNLFVVITTQKALYFFENQIDSTRKSDYFLAFFSIFRDASLADLKYQEFPNEYAQSEIQVYVKNKPVPSQLLQRQFAWITGAGLYYTEIDPVNVQESFLKRSRIIDYYFDRIIKERDEEKPPKSIALTEYHCLMMFPNENQIRAVCTVNEKVVMIDGSMTFGRPVCYARDQLRNQLWLCTDENVLLYKIQDELRDVWRVFMQKNEFLRALETCVVENNQVETLRRKRAINSQHADHLFNEKKYILSAQIYATSDSSFEDVTLKLFALRDREPLREYLQAVLQLQKPGIDSTQITILTLWLTDLFLNELDELRQGLPNTNPTTSPIRKSASTNRKLAQATSQDDGLDEKSRRDKIEEIRQKFRNFLRKNEIQSCLSEHKSAMYDLLTSHGDLDDLILFAEHARDYERVILLYLEREDYQKALNTLEPLENNSLLYKYSTILIEKLPDQLISVWKKKYQERLQPKLLLPAMIAYSRAFPTGKAVLDFLKFCLSRGCRDRSIHNYLLSEYAKFEPAQIMPYLIHEKNDIENTIYDPRYALRLCLDNNLKRESVFLYRMLNMHEEAVETALEVDVKLAKECASAADPSNNDERRKKLWLKIACSVITQSKDLNEVMEILDESGNDLLKIEDILPLFPDFDTIDQFKKPIIKSLDRYNDRLTDLRTEMEDASKSIDEIRDDLAKYRTRCVATIDANENCSLCDQTLMLQSTFYIFACGHYFHGDCLFSYVQKLITAKEKRQIDPNNSLGKSSSNNSTSKTLEMLNRLKSIIASGAAPASRDMDSVQQELDDLLASQCVLCGETAVDCLDQPLDVILGSLSFND